MRFLDLWLGYAILGSISFALVLTWAVRTRQFSDLDRGRYIPLDERVTPDEAPVSASALDVWGVRLIALTAAAAIAAAIVLAIRNA